MRSDRQEEGCGEQGGEEDAHRGEQNDLPSLPAQHAHVDVEGRLEQKHGEEEEEEEVWVDVRCRRQIGHKVAASGP